MLQKHMEIHRLLRYPLLYHPHPKTRPKQGLIKACLDLLLEWGWYRRGYLKIPWLWGGLNQPWTLETSPGPLWSHGQNSSYSTDGLYIYIYIYIEGERPFWDPYGYIGLFGILI